MDNIVHDFFVEDIRKMAPPEALLPPQEDVIDAHLWEDLIVDLYLDQIRYTSSTHRCLSYHIPFVTPGELQYHHLVSITYRFKTLVCWGCVKRVKWNVHGSPRKRASNLFCHCFNSLRGVSTMTVNILPYSGLWGARMVRYLGDTYQLDNLILNITQGNFTTVTRLGCRLITQLNVRSISEWTPWVRLHIEIATISTYGQEMLKSIAPLIELITFDVLDKTNKPIFNCVLSLLHSTRTKMELNVTNWEIKGATTVHLPRGNLSISIGAISPESSVFISCNGELSCLTVGKRASEHIYGPKLSIYELRVTDEPDSATLTTLRSRFSSVFRVSRLVMGPRLSALRGHNLWWKHL